MPASTRQLVSAYANGDSGTVVTVTAGHAKAAGLTVLNDEPAVDKRGLPLLPRKATGRKPAKKTAAKKTATKRTAKKAAGRSSTSRSTSNGGNTTQGAASTPEEASK